MPFDRFYSKLEINISPRCQWGSYLASWVCTLPLPSVPGDSPAGLLKIFVLHPSRLTLGLLYFPNSLAFIMKTPQSVTATRSLTCCRMSKSAKNLVKTLTLSQSPLNTAEFFLSHARGLGWRWMLKWLTKAGMYLSILSLLRRYTKGGVYECIHIPVESDSSEDVLKIWSTWKATRLVGLLYFSQVVTELCNL